MLKTNRSLVKYIFLSLITFGIYGLVVMCSLSSSLNTVASRYDGKRTMNFILIMLVFSWMTLGIAPLVWYTRMSSRIGNELTRRNVHYSFGAGTFWGWNVLGSLIVIGPLVYLHKLFKAMNYLCQDFNTKGE